MKGLLINLVIGSLLFGFGWCANDMQKKTNDVIGIGQYSEFANISADSLKAIRVKKKKISDYVSDEHLIRWEPRHPDTTKYMCEITLYKITALYQYHGQCIYDYFTYRTSDTTIDIIWSYRSDCMLNMDFLEKPNGVKKFPTCGDYFATLTLHNETTLKATYNFPEWTKRVNEIAGDSLFPTYYYLIKNTL